MPFYALITLKWLKTIFIHTYINMYKRKEKDKANVVKC